MMTVSNSSEASDKNVIRLFVIRHGQTDFNIKQIMQGHKDMPLNETGFKQSELLGEELLKSSYKFDFVASSDLTRCKQTVATVLKTSNQNDPVAYYYDLRERCMGEIEGMQINDAERYAAAHGKKSFREFGESAGDFLKRFSTCFISIAEKAAENDYKNVAIFTHGGAIKSLLQWLDCSGSIRIPNTSVTEIDYYKDTKQFKVQTIANDQHLSGQSGTLRFIGDSRVL